MALRNEFVGIVVIVGVFLLLLVFTQKEERRYEREPQVSEDYINASTATIADVVRLQRGVIKQSLADYRFPIGDRPLRTLVITTWRSGSTFLGAVLNAIPGNFYHYEPLLDFGIVQIRGPPLADAGISNMKSLLNCDYTNLHHYLNYGRHHINLFQHNTRLWSLCRSFPKWCWNPKFLNEICKLYPFQSMKSVRLRLKLAEQILEDEELNVKVVLMVRDPRGIVQSRKHREWCPGEPDCDKPNLLCADMVSDYSAAIQLKRSYPDRFRFIRYEDLSLDPYRHIQKLFEFLNLYFHPAVSDFLDSHTKFTLGGVSSTFRDSKIAPFHWRMDLNFTEVQYIEENCEEAMKLWGYTKALNETHLREFNPLVEYVVE